MARKRTAPVLREWVERDTHAEEVRAELSALLAAAGRARHVLRGLDALMNEAPPLMFPQRAYLVERSALLRQALARLDRVSGQRRR